MSTEQLAFQLADAAFASTDPGPEVEPPHGPLWQRDPDHETCTFSYRPSESLGEPDDHFWTCWRTYSVTAKDQNAGITLTDLQQIKRLMIEQLSSESRGLTTEQKWEYELRWAVWRADEKTWLTCWLE
jgi:hypothetical protein